MNSFIVNQLIIIDSKGNRYLHVKMEVFDVCSCKNYKLMWADPDYNYEVDNCERQEVKCSVCNKKLGVAISSYQDVFLFNRRLCENAKNSEPKQSSLDFQVIEDINGINYFGLSIKRVFQCSCTEAHLIWKDMGGGADGCGGEVCCSRCGEVVGTASGNCSYKLRRSFWREHGEYITLEEIRQNAAIAEKSSR